MLLVVLVLVLPVPVMKSSPSSAPRSIMVLAVMMPSCDDRRFAGSSDAAAPDDVVWTRDVKRDETTRSAEKGSSNMLGSPCCCC